MKSYLPMILFVLLFICVGMFNILSRLQLGAELRGIDYVIPILAPVSILLFLLVFFVRKLASTTEKNHKNSLSAKLTTRRYSK